MRDPLVSELLGINRGLRDAVSRHRGLILEIPHHDPGSATTQVILTAVVFFLAGMALGAWL